MDGNLLPVTCIATSILTVALVVVTTVSNGFLLYVLYKDPLKRFTKPVTTFITAIAIMDFLTGALCDPSQARFEIRCALKMETETEFELRGFTAIVAFFTVNSATLLIVAMSVERFLAVTFPHFYRQAVTRKRAKLCVIAVCIYCFVFSLLQLTDVDLGLWETVDLYMHTVFPIILVIVTYAAISVILRKQRNTFQSVNDKIKGNDGTLNRKRRRNQTQKQKNERQIVVTAFLISLLLILAFLPYTIVIIEAANCKNCLTNEWFVVFSRVAIPFVFMNSAVNPFVYVLRMRDLRRSMKMTLGCLTGNKNTITVERRHRNTGEANNSSVVVTNQFNCRNTGESNNSSEIVANQSN